MDLHELTQKVLATPQVERELTDQLAALTQEPQRVEGVRTRLNGLMEESIVFVVDIRAYVTIMPEYTGWKSAWKARAALLLREPKMENLLAGYSASLKRHHGTSPRTLTYIQEIAKTTMTVTGLIEAGISLDEFYR